MSGGRLTRTKGLEVEVASLETVPTAGNVRSELERLYSNRSRRSGSDPTSWSRVLRPVPEPAYQRSVETTSA